VRRLALFVVVTLGCGGRLAATRSAPPAVEPRDVGSFAPYGDAPALVVARPGVTYEFVREPVPTDVDLHALVITISLSGKAVYAVGDDGVTLRRTPSTPWQREPSGTHARLDAVGRIEDQQLLAVGEHGTALVRGRDGRWRPEATGVEVELTALAGGLWPPVAIAVGRGGVLVERGRDGRWSSIATRTSADLRAAWLYEDRTYIGSSLNEDIDNLTRSLYLAGDGGVIIHCGTRHHHTMCIPRPSPTTADLLGFGQIDLPLSGVVLFSADRRTLRPTGVDPFTWTVSSEPTGGAIFVRAVAKFESWDADNGMVRVKPEPLAVGRAGRAAFLTADGPVEITLAGGADLADVATLGFDYFAVGQHGTILHGVARGVSMPPPVRLSTSRPFDKTRLVERIQ
jgi:hypothetical protein